MSADEYKWTRVGVGVTKWSVEEWTGREWLMTGSEVETREDVGVIGPRIEPPEVKG